jgi:hypothetical protein
MMELGVEEISSPLKITGFLVRKSAGKKFVVYLLEYEKDAAEQGDTAPRFISRRFRQFKRLHKQLRRGVKLQKAAHKIPPLPKPSGKLRKYLV